MRFLALGIGLWLVLLFVLIGVRMLRGDILLSGMLTNNAGSAGKVIDPERLITLIAFSLVLGAYALEAAGTDVTAGADRPRMPEVPEALLALLVGSNGLYLAGKMMRVQ